MIDSHMEDQKVQASGLKIYFGSDLHLEFEKGDVSKLELPVGDVLVLAGDIFMPWSKDKRANQLYQEFFGRCSANFSHVILIAGNHDYWRGEFLSTHRQIVQLTERFGNIHVLNNSAYQVGDVVFWGSTFWTDCRKGDPQVMWDVQRNMNDYNETVYSNPTHPDYRKIKLLAEHTVCENKHARQQLEEFMSVVRSRSVTPIIVTHHAPTWSSVAREHRRSDLSYGYANTGLEEFMESFPDSVWIHGHMHDDFDYMVGKCRVLCNPRGYYGYESKSVYFKFKQLELP